jgi:hypothetical protein
MSSHPRFLNPVQINSVPVSGATGGTLTYDGVYLEVYENNTSNKKRLNDSNLLTLTYGATVNWDTSLGNIAHVTLTGNAILGSPTNLSPKLYYLYVIQDGTGSRTLDFSGTGGVIRWGLGEYPVLSTAANAVDLVTFLFNGTNLDIIDFKKTLIGS